MPARAIALAALAAVTISAIVVGAGGAPVAWLLLAWVAALNLGVVVYAALERRYFEPLPVLALASLGVFVLRPLQLFLGADDLWSFFAATGSVDSLIRLETQEVSLFATERVADLSSALTRAIGAAAVFTTCLFVGYLIAPKTGLASRLSRVGRRVPAVNVVVVVPLCLAIGVVAQVILLQRAGGLSVAANHLGDQVVLSNGLALIAMSSFSIAGVLIWLLWRRPEGRLEWTGFVLAVVETSAFYAVGGSRARVFMLLAMLAIVWHHRYRPFRRRELLVGAVLIALLASTMLVIRQGTFDRSLGDSVADAPSHMFDPRIVINDNTGFDALFYATTLIPSSFPYEHGQGLVDGVANFVPERIYPGKPEATDITFRRQVFGNRVSAGRPLTAVGEFYRDFSFAGIAVGSLLMGLLAGALLGLLRSEHSGDAGAFRLGLYAISLLCLYELMIGTYNIGIGFLLTLGVPYVVAVYLFGRLPLARTSEAAGVSLPGGRAS